MTKVAAGRLYVVATPIGNLADLSPRARAALEEASVIAAEDTRRTGTLLQHLGLRTPMVSMHEHNERARTPQLLERLRAGETIAVVSDAGTPGISDPGFDLVRAAADAGMTVIAVPGPCAAIAALSIAALPTDRFCFEGFLPARAAARRKRLEELALEPRTLVFYESPHRIGEMLEESARVLGASRPAFIARELTKLHESAYRGSLGDLTRRAREDKDLARGEIVVAIAGASVAQEGEAEADSDGHGGALDRALAILLPELPLKQAARLAAQLTGVRDNEAYKRALKRKGEAERS